MFDLETLTRPISSDDPCGSDLDVDGDLPFLNYFASVEPLFPTSYFETRNANGEIARFDPKSINFEQHFEAAKPLLERTRDLRLVVLLSKLSILNRDLKGFLTGLEAIVALLDQNWEDVHPRAESGDYQFRGVAIEALDVLPTVVMPLQFVPLVNHRRFGAVTYRSYLLARGDVAASGTEQDALDLGTIDRVMADADVEHIRAVNADLARLVAAVEGIGSIFSDKAGQPVSLERLRAGSRAMSEWMSSVLVRRDPTAAPSTAGLVEAETAAGDGNPISQDGNSRVTSTATAAAALAAVAEYFARTEPSSPALLLVRQAEKMLGRSFVEVMRMLVPAHVEQAAIQIGREHAFDLPIERLAVLMESPHVEIPALSEQDRLGFVTGSRAHALRLMEQVAGFYRFAEPSSPVPFLMDRARELAQSDFVTVLKSVLPAGVLKTPDTNQSQ